MTLASATGDNNSVKRLSMAAARKKIAALNNVKPQTNATDRTPAGIARIFVRGLRASYSRSAMRLKAIAVDRAPTIATTIQTICHSDGIPRAASTAPRKANGNANSVCSILIISSVVRMFLRIMLFRARTCPRGATSRASKRWRSYRPSILSRSNAVSQTDREYESINDRPALRSFVADDKNWGWPQQSAHPRAPASAYSQDEL